MPIDLTNMQIVGGQSSAAVSYSPKFFSDKLTGRGGNSPGMLSVVNNPPSIPVNLRIQTNDKATRRYRVHQNSTTVTHLPMTPLTLMADKYMHTIKHPDFSDMFHLGIYGSVELWLHMEVHAVTLEDTEFAADPMTGAKRHVDHEFRACYELTFYEIHDRNTDECKRDQYHVYACPAAVTHNIYWREHVVNPMQELLDDLVTKIKSGGWTVSRTDLKDYLMKYDLYASAARRSKTWQTEMDAVMSDFMNNIKQDIASGDPEVMNILQNQVKYLMSYNIPLEQYRTIYKDIRAALTPQDSNAVCKQNLNLLLSDTMDKLETIKPQIQPFVPPQNAPAPVGRFSPQQIAAVMTDQPLTLVQSGAGTGKSTMILGRIAYMVACGVKPSDIMVLSFTNAAADHIMEKNPNVKSMTIAKMIHTIYEANFPGHRLSELGTLMNTLDIYYPRQMNQSRGIVDDFQHVIKNLFKGEPNCYTEANSFIELHYNEVMDILNTVGQTTLELEIIICYQSIDSLTEPAEIASKYLIIDEVQDNSVFEFVYVLKYIAKHLESLFIVGDCSQTLYEFRSSNPRAMNILEASQVFQTYQLTTNYRSNQEILDFANMTLSQIEANQYAQIRLRANSLAPVTEQSFMDKVQLNYVRVKTQKELQTNLPSIFASDVNPYIKQCLARGEQVAFLAHLRHDIDDIQKILTQQFPQCTSANLVPAKPYSSTIMSQFIKNQWNGIQFMPYTDIPAIIYKEIMAHLKDYARNVQKATQPTQDMLSDWIRTHGNAMDTWIQQAIANQITEQELLENIKNCMLQFEIKRNADRLAVTSSKNRAIKQNGMAANANFLLSTIHSAKGLEFQNVVILYAADKAMQEENKRMYYVAMTRAMNSEYILAYGTTASSRIQNDYIDVLGRLHSIAPSPNSFVAQLQTTLRGGKRVKI